MTRPGLVHVEALAMYAGSPRLVSRLAAEAGLIPKVHRMLGWALDDARPGWMLVKVASFDLPVIPDGQPIPRVTLVRKKVGG